MVNYQPLATFFQTVVLVLIVAEAPLAGSFLAIELVGPLNQTG